MDLRTLFVNSMYRQELVQFRKLRIPSTDSYDGSAERPTTRAYLVPCRLVSPIIPSNLDTAMRPRLMATPSSLQSTATGIDQWVDDSGWNTQKLLDLSDSIRATLGQGKKLSFAELEDLNFVLDMMIVDKLDDDQPSKAPTAKTHRVTFPDIQEARLDKLLVDMLTAYEREKTAVNMHGVLLETGLGSELEAASTLRSYWQSRFKSQYLAIDKYRFHSLMSGTLKDVVFSAVASDGLGIWVPKETREISEAEGNLFVPGQ